MDNSNTSSLRIDIEAVIASKNPKLLKVLPRFLINYIKRILHQDELNDIIYKIKDLRDVEYIDGGLKLFGTNYSVKNADNIPENGRFIFAGNHPLGGLDGMVLISAVGKKFPSVKFVVNDLLMNLKNMDGVFVPINKHGRQSTEYARKIEETYQSDSQVLYFPAGLCSRKIKGKIVDLAWQKSFIAKAIDYKRDIIPFHVEAKNSNFFYNLARLRKFLGIKANVEMFYLVDEMFKQKDKKITVTFGKPIPYTLFDKSKNHKEWGNYVREIVYNLASD